MNFPVRVFIMGAFALIFISCKKEHVSSGDVLSGTWVKGSDYGDTLQFLRKDNKNILRYNMSLNAGMPTLTEVEYQYKDGKLSVKLYPSVSRDYYPLDSFTWKQVGNEFEIRGIQLFYILASTQVYYTYRKI